MQAHGKLMRSQGPSGRKDKKPLLTIKSESVAESVCVNAVFANQCISHLTMPITWTKLKLQQGAKYETFACAVCTTDSDYMIGLMITHCPAPFIGNVRMRFVNNGISRY